MDKERVTHIVLQQSMTYNEHETVEVSHVRIGTIRHLRAQGLIGGEVINGELRYREDEIVQLRLIRRLQQELGINMAGVEVILQLLSQLEHTQQELSSVKER